ALKFNEQNSARALKKMFEPLENDYELCYQTDDPTISVMVLKARLYGNTFTFKEYLDGEVPNESDSSESAAKLGMILGFY
ncbi:hypothetical protein MBANPS3_012171, partial [Mucor bainieri]